MSMDCISQRDINWEVCREYLAPCSHVCDYVTKNTVECYSCFFVKIITVLNKKHIYKYSISTTESNPYYSVPWEI